MIEFLCTITGLIAGMVIVASFMAARQEQVQQDIEHTLDVIDSEKMRAVANQLKSLSQRVFSDVHAHNAKVEHFNLTLSRSGEDDPEKFFTAVEEIIQANAPCRNSWKMPKTHNPADGDHRGSHA